MPDADLKTKQELKNFLHHFHLTMPHAYSVSCNKSYEKFLLLMKLTWFIEIYIVWNETILWPQWQGIFWSEMITSHKMAWIFVVVHKYYRASPFWSYFLHKFDSKVWTTDAAICQALKHSMISQKLNTHTTYLHTLLSLHTLKREV